MNAAQQQSLYGTALNLQMLQGKQDPKHHRDKYEVVDLLEELKNKVIYTKIEGSLADTYHHPGSEWIEEFTGLRENIEPGYRGLHTIGDEGTIQGVPTDAGLIILFAGTCAPERIAVDTQSMEILTEAQAQLRETTFGMDYPRYNMWEFRIKQIIVTDGPARAANLHQSVEEQRATAETASFDKMGVFFEKLLERIEQRGGTVNSEAAQEIINAGKEMDTAHAQDRGDSIKNEDARNAVADMEAWETEDAGKKRDVDVPDMELKPTKKK